MRIAIFTDFFLPSVNGVAISIVNSSERLAKRGHKILIFTSRTKKRKKISLHRNISVRYLRPIRLLNYHDVQLAMPHPNILREIIRFKPQVIHSHMESPLGWEAVLCSKVFDIPLIGTCHGLLNDFIEHFRMPRRFKKSRMAKKFAWGYTQRYYNRCDLVTTPSVTIKNILKKQKIKRPIKVLSNGVDLKRFYPRHIKKDGKTVLHVGRVSCEKNIDILIMAFKIVLITHPKTRLLIAGNGPELSRLKKEAGSHLNKNIRFIGLVAHNKLARLYSSAAIFATASTIETEGLVILEAMACGLPIVGVDALAVPNIVKYGRNGFISQPKDINGFAKHIIMLLEKKELRIRFGKESVKIVKKFSVDGVVDEVEKMYRLLANK